VFALEAVGKLEAGKVPEPFRDALLDAKETARAATCAFGLPFVPFSPETETPFSLTGEAEEDDRVLARLELLLPLPLPTFEEVGEDDFELFTGASGLGEDLLPLFMLGMAYLSRVALTLDGRGIL